MVDLHDGDFCTPVGEESLKLCIYSTKLPDVDQHFMLLTPVTAPYRSHDVCHTIQYGASGLTTEQDRHPAHGLQLRASVHASDDSCDIQSLGRPGRERGVCEVHPLHGVPKAMEK